MKFLLHSLLCKPAQSIYLRAAGGEFMQVIEHHMAIKALTLGDDETPGDVEIIVANISEQAILGAPFMERYATSLVFSEGNRPFAILRKQKHQIFTCILKKLILT